MHAVAAQERTRMVVRRVPDRGIGVGATPGQDGGAVDHDIPPTHQAGMAGELHEHDEEHLGGWCATALSPLALLSGTGHAHPAVPVRRQAAR
jgi:hypothetical protein